MKLSKNILKTIGILILMIIGIIVISSIIYLTFFFVRPLFWVIAGMVFVIVLKAIWEAVTDQ